MGLRGGAAWRLLLLLLALTRRWDDDDDDIGTLVIYSDEILNIEIDAMNSLAAPSWTQPLDVSTCDDSDCSLCNGCSLCDCCSVFSSDDDDEGEWLWWRQERDLPLQRAEIVG